MDKQPVAYDDDKGEWYAVPVCPDCKETMTKAWIETHDNSGWYCGWLCGCKFDDPM